MKQSKTQITEVTERVFFCETADGILLEQETGTRRTGMWKLPALPSRSKLPPVLHKSRLWHHPLPRHALGSSEPRKSIRVLSEHHRRITTDELHHLPMPSPYRKALNAVLGARRFELKA